MPTLLTDGELVAYREYPETFFGVLKPNPKPITDALELYDCFFAQYRHTSKEKLLEFMGGDSISKEMRDCGSGRVRESALFGETTGETDEFGLPVRYNWAADYRGKAMVINKNGRARHCGLSKLGLWVLFSERYQAKAITFGLRRAQIQIRPTKL